MVKCSFEGCDADFEVHRMNRDLCKKHYRFMNMQTRARCSGLAVPPFDQLEALVPDGMNCPDCGKHMGWLLKEVGYSQMATLQHYRSGEFGIVCGACNTRHHYMPEDTYRELPDGHKWCKDCDTVKPYNEFWADNEKSKALKIHSVCIPCGRKRNLAKSDYQKARYAKKKGRRK